MVQKIPVDAPDDPRLRPFVGARRHRGSGTALLEGRRVIARAAAADVSVSAVLATEAHAEALAPHLAPDTPLYVATHAILARTAGFRFHRGCLALAQVPAATPFDPAVADAIEGPVCAPVGLADPSNVGAILRTAYVLGFRAVLLDPRGADPFDPRAIRASAGCVFALRRFTAPRVDLALLKLARRGARVVAAETGGTPLSRVSRRPAPAVLAVGGEDRGLPSALVRGVETVEIPTAAADVSFNVHAAFAIVAHAFFGDVPVVA
ncbi:MAG: TrmH family RNA methyltransferase [Deltaproteobacteria bacterium]|nr:MAG: TrmH family RNA methyltransferase [Deltaproteobacteria bacterium]